MRENIHYEDNAYFLAAMIRNLHDAIKLNVDAEYFAVKILEDILFINTSIEQIYGTLKKNSQYIRKNIYLQSIMTVKLFYVKLLENILERQEYFGSMGDTLTPKLQRIAASHLADVRTIQDELTSREPAKLEPDLTSYEELHYLMNPVDEAINV